MNIGIDIRSLTTPYPTGVGEYTVQLLRSLVAERPQDQFFLFYNSWKDCSAQVPTFHEDNIHLVATKYPNKLFHASMVLFGWPHIDQMITKRKGIALDYFFSPNLNF